MVRNQYFYTEDALYPYIKSYALPRLTFINCSFEKVNPESINFNNFKLDMTIFYQSILDSISVTDVKVKYAECKEWLKIENSFSDNSGISFSNFKNYFGRSDNRN